MEIHKIDLIILDIMLPGMDGYAFAELLRDCGFQYYTVYNGRIAMMKKL